MTSSPFFVVSEAWRAAFHGAFVGALAVRGVANPERHLGLETRKREVEIQLRGQFAGKDRAAVRALPTIQAYAAYYKRFDKTYHVQSQLESVALKAKSFPTVAALVEAMFVAELESQLLTAGHDLATLELPVMADVSRGTERYVVMSGQEQVLKPRDMFMSDRRGIISSILYGPDQRTQIGAGTTSALFTVYAPAGITERQVRKHLERLGDYAKMIAPDAQVDLPVIFGA